MKGRRPELARRLQSLRNALFVYPDAPPGNAPGREDHLEVERKTRLLSNAQSAPSCWQ
jgi:hypothetical protein